MPRRSTETGKTLRPHPGTGHRKSAAKEKFLSHEHSFRALYEATPVEHSRLVSQAGYGVYGVLTIRPTRSQ